MERPEFSRDRLRDLLRVNRNLLILLLIVVVIFMAGFLGVMTGFYVLIEPRLEAGEYIVTTTTIPATTSTTTTTVTTTSTTTIPSEPCSPCFEYFSYVGHNDQFLSMRNGYRTVKITKASQTEGGTMVPDFNMDYVYPNQLIIFTSSYPEGTEVTIEYVDITSVNARLDSATLY